MKEFVLQHEVVVDVSMYAIDIENMKYIVSL